MAQKLATFFKSIWFFTLLSMMLFTFLGTWQLMRLEWKTNLILSYRQGLQQPATKFDANQYQSYHENQKVLLKGTFYFPNPLSPARIKMKTMQGRVGVHLIMPFSLSDSGMIVWVNLGWAPENFKYAPPEGDVIVEGVIRYPKPPGYFTPENESPYKEIFYIDFLTLSNFFGRYSPAPYYIEFLTKTNTLRYPIPIGDKKVFKNNHLGYAITWYSLGICVLIYALIFGRRKREPKNV